MSETDENEPTTPGDATGKGFSTPFLQDPLAETKDIQIMATAVKKRWNIPDEIKDAIVDRLAKIVEKQYVDVMTKEGPEALDGPADANAIAASRVLVAIEGQNQSDDHVVLKTTEPSGSTTINIGAIGSISMGQEPLTPTDAKLQAEDILQRVLSRTKQPEPMRVENKLDDLSSI